MKHRQQPWLISKHRTHANTLMRSLSTENTFCMNKWHVVATFFYFLLNEQSSQKILNCRSHFLFSLESPETEQCEHKNLNVSFWLILFQETDQRWKKQNKQRRAIHEESREGGTYIYIHTHTHSSVSAHLYTYIHTHISLPPPSSFSFAPFLFLSFFFLLCVCVCVCARVCVRKIKQKTSIMVGNPNIQI